MILTAVNITMFPNDTCSQIWGLQGCWLVTAPTLSFNNLLASLRSSPFSLSAFTGRVCLCGSRQCVVCVLWGVDRRRPGVSGTQQLSAEHPRRLQSQRRLYTRRTWRRESVTVADDFPKTLKIMVYHHPPHPCFIFTVDVTLLQNKCECKSGYMGDGKACDRVNPCTVNYGGCHQLVRGRHYAGHWSM